MRTIKGGPADKAGIKFGINPDTAIGRDKERTFNDIIENPRITRVTGSKPGWKNKDNEKKGGYNDH